MTHKTSGIAQLFQKTKNKFNTIGKNRLDKIEVRSGLKPLVTNSG